MQLSSALRLGVYLLLSQVSQPWDPKEAFSRRSLPLTGVTQAAAADQSPCWVLGAFHVVLFIRVKPVDGPLLSTSSSSSSSGGRGGSGLPSLNLSPRPLVPQTDGGPHVPSGSRKHPLQEPVLVGKTQQFPQHLGRGG
ncbi:unnamed protein product [Arctogadus glacialis]